MPSSATPETIIQTIAMQIVAQQLSMDAKSEPTVYVDQRPYSLNVTHTSGNTSRAELCRQDDRGEWPVIADVILTSDLTMPGASC